MDGVFCSFNLAHVCCETISIMTDCIISHCTCVVSIKDFIIMFLNDNIT